MNFESVFKNHLEKQFSNVSDPAWKLLRKSLFYSLTSRASRFRPRLCFETTKALGQNPKKILPWAMAIEMIHSASLIHDDLPSMDNSRSRRGKKCNYLVFGEDIALLAGTCLFVESFSFLKNPVFDKKRGKLLELLISTVGFQGLMAGQAMDLRGSSLSKNRFLKMNRMKTAALIEASVLGPWLLWGKRKKEKRALENYAKHLGLAYQWADDLKDGDGFFKSKKETKKELETEIKQALASLKSLGKTFQGLENLALEKLRK